MRPDFQSASFSHTLVPCSFRNKDQNRLKMFSWNVLFLFLLHNSVLSGCSSFYVCCLSFWWMNCWFWLFCKLALYLNFMYNDFDCLPNHLLLPSVATFYIKTMSPSSCYTWRPKTFNFFSLQPINSSHSETVTSCTGYCASVSQQTTQLHAVLSAHVCVTIAQRVACACAC